MSGKTGRPGWWGEFFGGGWPWEILDAAPVAVAWVDAAGAPRRLNSAAQSLWALGPPRLVDAAGTPLDPPWAVACQRQQPVPRFQARIEGPGGGLLTGAAAPVKDGAVVVLSLEPADHPALLDSALLDALPGLAVLTSPGGVVKTQRGDPRLLDVPATLAVGRSLGSLLPRSLAEAWSGARGDAVGGSQGALSWIAGAGDAARRLRGEVRAVNLPFGLGEALAWLITEGGGGDPLAAQAAEESVDPLVTLDDTGAIVYCNAAFARLVERPVSQIVGEPFARFEASPGPIADSFRRLAADGSPWIETRVGSPDAPHAVCGVRIARVDAPGASPRFVTHLRELQHQEAVRAQQEKLKHTDPRTGLPNRDRLMHVLTHRAPNAGWAALALIGLPDIRDLGPRISETQESTLMKVAARRLREALPPSVEIVRAEPAALGLFLEDLGGQRATTTGVAADAGLLLQQALEALSEPIDLHGFLVRLKLAAGVTLCLGRGSFATYREAEFALRQNLQSNQREPVRFFDPSLWGVIESEMQLRAAAERALREARLALHFQPVVDRQGRALSAEGLLRWPEMNGRVPALGPMQIIQALEACGKLGAFTDWCIDSALLGLRALDGQGLRLPTMAVNVDAKALMVDDFSDRVEQLLRRRQISPERLTLELTEHAVVGDIGRAQARMGELEALGVQLVQDDFGTGHASLATLHRLPFQALKIDRSFVSEMVTDERAARIVEASTYLAKPLNLGVVAEGVEDQAQLDMLTDMGCEAFQGWLFARDLPLARLADWLREHGIQRDAEGFAGTVVPLRRPG